eukprot:4316984-Karenia_brevis.AAC.1
MATPGVEPGLSRPQRDVLTTRRCGLCSHEEICKDVGMFECPKLSLGICEKPVVSDIRAMPCFRRDFGNALYTPTMGTRTHPTRSRALRSAG